MQLHQRYRSQGFEILAFPTNQFMNHEPGTNEQIKKFAREKAGAEFPLFAKGDVNGPLTMEVYRYLRQNSELYDRATGEAREIPWNFSKFLLDAKGQVVSFHKPQVDPLDLTNQIEAILRQ